MDTYDQKMASLGGITSKIAPPVPSPVAEAAGALSMARELSLNVQALVDRALGSSTETLRGGSPAPRESNGVLSDLSDNAISTREIISHGMQALARLERAIS